MNSAPKLSMQPRVAVITGATSGIGFAVCRALLREGYRVAGVGRSPNFRTPGSASSAATCCSSVRSGAWLLSCWPI